MNQDHFLNDVCVREGGGEGGREERVGGREGGRREGERDEVLIIIKKMSKCDYLLGRSKLVVFELTIVYYALTTPSTLTRAQPIPLHQDYL